MEEIKQYEWLPHLHNAIPQEAFSSSINTYTVALEGWRRGLGLIFYTSFKKDRLQIRYKLISEDKEHHFDGSRGDMISEETIQACIHKDKTLTKLSKANVPIPEGRAFYKKDTNQEIIEYSNILGFPLVIKPITGSLGRGVVPNIRNTAELKQALEYVRQELNYPDIIMERFIDGVDYRLYVVGDEVIAGVYREPAHIIGDGEQTIGELIMEKNKERKNNPHLYFKSIKIDSEIIGLLKNKGLTLESIPAKGEKVYLRVKGNLSAGGDPIDITDDLTPEIKQIAIDAAKAVNAVQCGVDVLVDKEGNKGIVIEINSKAHIGSHLFPLKGKARDVPKAIIDYYFPETINIKRDSLFSLDYKNIIQPLKSMVAEEVIVPMLPNIRASSTSLLIDQYVGIKFKRWIQKQALLLNLNGYINNISKKTSLIVISGEEVNINEFKSLLYDNPFNIEKDYIVEEEWNDPVPIGFAIQNNNRYNENLELKEKLVQEENRHQIKLQKLELEYEQKAERLRTKLTNKLNVKDKKLKQATKENEVLLEEFNSLNKKYLDILDSRSWKITVPLRKINKILKSKE